MNSEHTTTLENKIERFSRILEQKPGDGIAVLALAEASFRRGLKLEALINYQAITREKNVAEAHLAIAEIYSNQSMVAEAFGELRQLFTVDPENVEARLLAHSLGAGKKVPEDVAEILGRPVRSEAFEEAMLRLQLQNAILNRELQERTRNVTLQPGQVIHEYNVEEAKKKLLEVQDKLRRLEELRDRNDALSSAPRPEIVAPLPSVDNEDSPVLVQSVPSEAPLLVVEADEAIEASTDAESVETAQLAGTEFSPNENPNFESSSLSAESGGEELLTFDPPSLEVLPNTDVETDNIPAFGDEDVALEDDFSNSLKKPVPDMGSLNFELKFSADLESVVSPELPEPAEDLTEIPPPVIEMFSSSEDPPSNLAAPLAFEPVSDDVEIMSTPVSSSEKEAEHHELAGSSLDAYYASKSDELSKLTGTLARTRGVTSIYLTTREGRIIESVVKDDVSNSRITELVRESFEFLLAYAKSPSYWVLECAGGIFVMQVLDSFHVLIAIGQAGANFGALRYTMDKTKAKFCEILGDIPT